MLKDTFFKILEFSNEGNKDVFKVEINQQHKIFEGHFPGNPVVPGVCLFQMVKECIEVKEAKKLQLSKAKEIKFLSIVNPQLNNVLHIEIIPGMEEDGLLPYNIVVYDGTNVCLKMKSAFAVSSYQ
ncbi:MAG: hypothetical protein PHR81_08920 [Bacteroidales bacterium]|jgi:3-hydroxyacyl-[acyl-carrier-protein] dehydratase|nr:hypothetical protein [Bacteroidales bacterium]MDD4214918.1 hypothetical protein [Bacteroidales bacterium]